VNGIYTKRAFAIQDRITPDSISRCTGGRCGKTDEPIVLMTFKHVHRIKTMFFKRRPKVYRDLVVVIWTWQ
jgi:hypothetical protein